MRRFSLVFVAAAAAQAALAACGGKAASPEPPADPAAESPPDGEAAAAPDAAAGVGDPVLAELLVDHWGWTMARHPVWATTLGDRRFDDELAIPSAAAIEAARAEARSFRERAREIDRDGLDPDDRITLDLFVEGLESAIEREVCDMHLWSVSPRQNPATRFGALPEQHRVETPEDGDNLLSRYRMIPEVIDATIDNLRRGAESGMVASAESLRRVIALIDGVLDEPVESWAMAAPARNERPDWPRDRAEAFAEELVGILRDDIEPALARYRAVLADELLPAGRDEQAEGVVALPQGEACYQALIRHYTALPELTAEELHELGLSEVERINAKIEKLGEELFDTRDRAAIIERLRTDDSLYFDSEEEIVETAERAVAAAREAMGEAFGILPEAEVVVVPIPDYEAPYTTIAYYRRPHADGSKPGEYFINTYEPETRPRFEAEVLAYHEAIPGHHLQIAIAQERGELPAFRRYSGNTAFVEGWALYTERLSDEMGLYSGDLDRMGMLSYDAWRANRLVVDTGIHAFGWTREQAEQFMRENTALTLGNIRNEVDRYITTPGQALAYKVGQLEIFRLRELARETLGEAFSLAEFHDEVLRRGAITMPVLADHIHAYIERAAAE